MMKTKPMSILTAILFWVLPLVKADAGEIVVWGPNVGGGAIGKHSGNQIYSQFFVPSTRTVSIFGRALTNAVDITAGMENSMALTSDELAVNWASPNEAEFVRINDAILGEVVAISVGRMHSVALQRNGTILAWGNNDQSQTTVPAGLRDVVAISAGGNHTLALTKAGTVVSWGEGNPPPVGLSNVVAISASKVWDTGHDLALTRSGELIQWNLRGVAGQGILPSELTNVIAISAGENHNLALLKDGRVFGWGYNSEGQAIGTATTNAPFSASGVVSIGGNVLSNAVAIAAGNHYSLALRNNGTVVAWGRIGGNYFPATVPDGLSNVVAIAAGQDFCLAITTNKAVAEKFSRN